MISLLKNNPAGQRDSSNAERAGTKVNSVCLYIDNAGYLTHKNLLIYPIFVYV